MKTFVVKLRSLETRSWGDEMEVAAETAKDAGQQAAGETLREAVGVRADLRARVWPTPYGSSPDIMFYALRAP